MSLQDIRFNTNETDEVRTRKLRSLVEEISRLANMRRETKTIVQSGDGTVDPTTLSAITVIDETLVAPSSRRLVAGDGVSISISNPGQLVLSSTVNTSVFRGVADPVPWGDLSDVPLTFPPSAHTHAIADVTGLQAALDSKLDASLYTASDVLAKLLTVDGAASGLDADLLDGQHGSYYLDAGNLSAGTLNDARVAASNVTQHQAALSINWSQLTSVPSTFPPSAHTHLWAEITDKPSTFTPSAHAHVAADVTDFSEAVDDRVAALLVAGSNISLTYNDGANTLTIDNTWSSDYLTFVAQSASPGANTLWMDDGSNYESGTMVWPNQSVFLGEMSIGAPGNEQGSIQVNGSAYDAILKINEFGGTRDAALILHRHATSTAATLAFARARGTGATHVNVQDGDVIGFMDFVGWHTSSYHRAAEITVEVDGSPGAADMPGRIVFKVSPDGSQTPEQALTITSSKEVRLGTDGFMSFDEHASAPGTPPSGRVALYAKGDGRLYLKDDVGTEINLTAVPTWGSITGTLSAQTDLQSALDAKLNASAYTASDVLSKLLTVDGSGSGLDADLLDGQSGAYYLAAANITGDVSFSQIAQINSSRILGRVSAGTGDIEELTGAQATALLDVFTASLKGLVPASGGGTTNFLRADGTWAAPPSGGSVSWGSITGTLSNQTDLQSALNAKLDASAYTASDVLSKLLTVDGAGSGIDADLLDGQSGAYYLAWSNLTGVPSTFTPSAHTHSASDITSGTLSDARLSTNVALLSGTQTFTGAKTFSARPIITSSGALFTANSISSSGEPDGDLVALPAGLGVIRTIVSTTGATDVPYEFGVALQVDRSASGSSSADGSFRLFSGGDEPEPYFGVWDDAASKWVYAAFSMEGHTHLWADITDKPSTFTPSAHTHAASDITSGVIAKQHVRGIEVADTRSENTAPASLIQKATQFDFKERAVVGAPGNHTYVGVMSVSPWNDSSGGPNYQMVFTNTSGTPFLALRLGNSGGSWGSWREVSFNGHTHLWADITDKPPTFTPSAHTHPWADITDKPSTFTPTAHTHLWADITDKPSTFTPSAHTHLWADITDKPSTFTPSAHAHLWADITDKPSTFTPSAHTHAASDITSGVIAKQHVRGIEVVDTRSVNTAPDSLIQKAVQFDFKERAVVGAPGSPLFVGVMSFSPWVDATGGPNYQLAFSNTSSEPILALRLGNSGGPWGSWREVSFNGHTHLWADITDKPSTFTPSAHTHAASDITSGTLADARLSSNVPLLTLANTFTQPQKISNPTPWMGLDESDQAADERWWLFLASGKSASIRAYDDSMANNRIAWSATRGTGYAISSIVYGNTTDNPPHYFYGVVTATNGINVGSFDTTLDRLSAGKLGVEGRALLAHGGSYTSGNITFSTSAPSGGSDGDIWFQYT